MFWSSRCTVVVGIIALTGCQGGGSPSENPNASSSCGSGSVSSSSGSSSGGITEQDAGHAEPDAGHSTSSSSSSSSTAGSSVSSSSSSSSGGATCGDGVVEGCTADGSSGDYNCQMMHGGLMRSFLLHVPPSYQQRPSSGATLIFNFHGLHITAGLERWASKMNASSDTHGFVVVYPEGSGAPANESWNAGICCGESVQNHVDDVGFTLAILERVQAALCIDPRRVFSTGLSNGGHISYRLACEQASVFAAIAAVSGLETVTTCNPSRPVPVLHFHGTSDLIVNYNVGIDGVHGAEQVVSAWATRNGCGTSPDVVYSQGEVTCRSYPGCTQGSAAELCTITGGGHQWPGGEAIPLLGHKTDDISATEYMVAFFDAHPMP